MLQPPDDIDTYLMSAGINNSAWSVVPMCPRRHSPGLISVCGRALWARWSLVLLRLGVRTIVLVVAFVEATVWSSSLWLAVLRHLGTGSKLLSLRWVYTHVWH